MAENLAPGFSLRFLLMAFLYRAWGLDGYFAIRGALALRLHAKHYLHYLLLTVREQDGYRTLDTLHLESVEGVPRSGVTWFSKTQLESLALDYWKRYVPDPHRTHHRESAYWLLQIGSSAKMPPAERNALALARQLATDFLHHPRTADIGHCKTSCVDARHLGSLRDLRDRGAKIPEWRMRTYLMEVNNCNLQWRILTDALATLSPQLAAQARDIVTSRCQAAASLRTRVFLAVLMGNTSTAPAWSQVADELWVLAQSLRDELLPLVKEAISAT